MRILLFCDFELPLSCANATRVISFAKIFRALGHSVELLGVCYRDNVPLSGTHDGFDYEMIRAGSWIGLKAYKRIRRLSNDIDCFLQERSKENGYDVILLSNVYFDYSRVFCKYAKKNGAQLLVNSVEWYDSRNPEFLGLLGKIKLIKNRIALRKIHVKMNNIIAISSLLNDYYQKRGCNTVTVPTIVDVKEYEQVNLSSKPTSDIIHIAYAGSPAKKDYVMNAIKALQYLSDEERSRIVLDFYGPTEKQICFDDMSRCLVDKYRSNIVCHGRIPHKDVKKKIAEADFTVLLRPDKRYANAGFPTKVGESMACGTPVIANLTSDLNKYIIEGQTGVVCEDESPRKCADALVRALSLTWEEREKMKKNCLNMANSSFDYRAYIEELSLFLENAKPVR